jgi:bifunctional enzyme CysN/CysC
MAEREQGITIDVAHRYFSTARRKFIVADTPGHVQYTRNMATGASGCDAAVILIDARLGVLDQTRRHFLICALMGIRQLAFAINKMDLAGWDQGIYETIRSDCRRMAAELQELGLETASCPCIPVSALCGDNLSVPSASTPWYSGPTLLQWLEEVPATASLVEKPLRLPIQYVIKPGLGRGKWQETALTEMDPERRRNYRGYAGQIASGRLAVGDPVMLLPSGHTSVVSGLLASGRPVTVAEAGDSVAVELRDDLDISRGDCLCHPHRRPATSNLFRARLVWMEAQPLYSGRRYLFQSAAGLIPAEIVRINSATDLTGYRGLAVHKLEMNDVGDIDFALSRPIPFDPYQENRTTGAFIFIDRLDNATAGAGMILHPLRRAENIHWQRLEVTRENRASLMGQHPCVLWFTGLSGSGKSTIANLVEKKLYSLGRHTMLLDGDNVRHGLNRDLGFTETDRIENIRRVGETAKLMTDAGLIILTAFISPFRAERELARNLFTEGDFIEIFVSAPLAACEQRDPKGLYRKARQGEIPNFTGINSPYEVPETPELVLDTLLHTPEELADQVVALLLRKGVI